MAGTVEPDSYQEGVLSPWFRFVSLLLWDHPLGSTLTILRFYLPIWSRSLPGDRDR